AKATVTVEQTGATSDIGDLYIGEDGNAIGVIINKDEEKNKIYIISTEEKNTPFTDKDNYKIYVKTDYYDGQKALAQLKGEEDWETKFAIAAYCAELEERTKVKGWYIAAAYENGVWDALRENETTINTVLSSINATELGATQPDHPFFWTATTDSRYFDVDKYIESIITKDKANQWENGFMMSTYDYIARCVLKIEYLSE
ncbi:MAG: hypothetical protein K2L23_00105, partial [Odoribacter sp.]|nr:hypothetical protein [Odoribacter sp.]